ncbi:MAG: monovalent cation/H+ antiporter complex subunit F [Candidatus Natronoplasma sp.]
MTPLNIFSVLLVFLAGLSSYRIIQGPSPYDRLLGLNVVSVIISVLFVTLSVATDMGSFLDIAIVFIVLNFIATLGFAKYLGRGDFR